MLGLLTIEENVLTLLWEDFSKKIILNLLFHTLLLRKSIFFQGNQHYEKILLTTQGFHNNRSPRSGLYTIGGFFGVPDLIFNSVKYI